MSRDRWLDRWENLAGVAVAAFVGAIGCVGVAKTEALQPWAPHLLAAAVLLGALTVLFLALTVLATPPLHRRRVARSHLERERTRSEKSAVDAAQRRLEQEEKRRALARKREIFEPQLEAWVRFLPAAQGVRSLYLKLDHVSRTDEISAADWRRFRKATRQATDTANQLPEKQRDYLLGLLKPFCEARKDRLHSLWGFESILDRSLMTHDQHYRRISKQLGLKFPEYAE